MTAPLPWKRSAAKMRRQWREDFKALKAQVAEKIAAEQAAEPKLTIPAEYYRQWRAKLTPEQLEKRREADRKRYADPECRAKAVAYDAQRRANPAVIAARKAAEKRRRDAETVAQRAARRARQRRYENSPKGKATRKKRNNAKWQEYLHASGGGIRWAKGLAALVAMIEAAQPVTIG